MAIAVFPLIACGAGTFGVFSVASLSGAAGLVGAGAGLGKSVFIAKFRLGFETSPFVSKGTFDSRAAGARGFGIAQGCAILRRNALGRG